MLCPWLPCELTLTLRANSHQIYPTPAHRSITLPYTSQMMNEKLHDVCFQFLPSGRAHPSRNLGSSTVELEADSAAPAHGQEPGSSSASLLQGAAACAVWVHGQSSWDCPTPLQRCQSCFACGFLSAALSKGAAWLCSCSVHSRRCSWVFVAIYGTSFCT